MEDGGRSQVEIARYLAPDVEGYHDPVFEHYHASSEVDLAEQLLTPGGVSATFDVTTVTSFSSTGLTSFLPPKPEQVG